MTCYRTFLVPRVKGNCDSEITRCDMRLNIKYRMLNKSSIYFYCTESDTSLITMDVTRANFICRMHGSLQSIASVSIITDSLHKASSTSNCMAGIIIHSHNNIIWRSTADSTCHEKNQHSAAGQLDSPDPSQKSLRLYQDVGGNRRPQEDATVITFTEQLNPI